MENYNDGDERVSFVLSNYLILFFNMVVKNNIIVCLREGRGGGGAGEVGEKK